MATNPPTPRASGATAFVHPDEGGEPAGGPSSGEAVSLEGCPIVGLGASAGGLEALRQLFAALPPDTGMAFVVIQHLDPGRPSMLATILAGYTAMPVVEAAGGMRVERNHVYVIPPGDDLVLRDGSLALVPRPVMDGAPLHLPIDRFFASIAEELHSRAVGVVLSGSASDGTEGLRSIKAEGGITFVQEPSSAQFSSMPESAIAAGLADFRLRPEQIAAELARLGSHPYLAEARGDARSGGAPSGAAGDARVAGVTPNEPDAASDQRHVASILGLIRQHTENDFTGYKRAMLQRRIARRMALRREATLEEYEAALRSDPSEVHALAADILVHFTSFFRDPEAFEALRQMVFPELLKQKRDGGVIRIWVPGCSTGEEVYSFAICFLELIEAEPGAAAVSLKIFGSDLAHESVDTARRGTYSAAAVAGLSPQRLSRFFEKIEGGYQVCKAVRGLCVFVRHDLIQDPPFAKLDIISCRNVLIYFDAELQRRLLPLLHHCLNQSGYLFLGRSEALSAYQDLFRPLDRAHRIFLKVGESRRLHFPLSLTREAEARFPLPVAAERRAPARDAQRQAEHILLARFAPAGVLVNERFEIIQYRGRTGAYLEAPPGQPQRNVVRMARDGLAAHLHEALEAARSKSVSVRRENVQIHGPKPLLVDIEVLPLASIPDTAERFFLVLFEETGAGAGGEPQAWPSAAPVLATPAAVVEVARIQAELDATKDYLQSTQSEHLATQDELANANEGLIAANEELQSTNEELQSAKEELQSTNEELRTLNDELSGRNQDLDLLANDLANILDSTDIPILIVDAALRIRRFTPTLQGVANLRSGDLGRPLADIHLRVHVEGLMEKIQEVLTTATVKEWEVERDDGRWCRLRIRPYRTADNRLDGAILSFVDVDALKRAVQEAERARDYARGIVETVPVALIVLDEDLRVVSANHAYYDRFSASPDETEGQLFFDLVGGFWAAPALRDAVRRTVEDGERFRDVEIVGELPVAGHKAVAIAGRALLWKGGVPRILLALDDITERRALEQERLQLLESEKQSRLEAERANRTKDLFLATLSHELRTPLSAILLQAQLLQRHASGDPKLTRASTAIARAANSQARLIDDLLDISRIVAGKLLLDLTAVDLAAVVQGAVDLARGAAEAKPLQLDVGIDEAAGHVYGDSARLQQIVTNLLNNAIKFTPAGGRVSVRLERLDGRAKITVADTGMGIRSDFLPHLFERFAQGDSSILRMHGGLGLGLAIVQHLVAIHGGEVHAESPGEGKGATFSVTVPVGTVDASRVVAEASVSSRSIAGMRVLVVDDDDDARDALCALLTDLGAVVRGAASSAAGLAALDEGGVDVILSDIAMPKENGYAFIRKVRERSPERGGQTPAAALTALAAEEDRMRALSAGFQMHLAKPIDAARLVAAVGQLANRSA